MLYRHRAMAERGVAIVGCSALLSLPATHFPLGKCGTSTPLSVGVDICMTPAVFSETSKGQMRHRNGWKKGQVPYFHLDQVHAASHLEAKNQLAYHLAIAFECREFTSNLLRGFAKLELERVLLSATRITRNFVATLKTSIAQQCQEMHANTSS